MLGYLRDIFIAVFLGTGVLADVFFVAFRIPNTFRRLFSEGTFNAAFVPSYASEMVKGKNTDEATKIRNTDIATTLALPPVKIHCSVLAEDAIKAALADLQGKQQAEGTWSPK